MASDQEIAEGLEALFREINPNSFNSLNEVVLRLQSKLGFDLSDKIDFIRAQITLFFSIPQPQPQPPPPPQQQPSPPPPVVVSRPPPPTNPNPNPNLNVLPPNVNVNVNAAPNVNANASVSHHHHQHHHHDPNVNVNANASVSHHPNISVSHHPHRPAHTAQAQVQGQVRQQHVFHSQSHFPRGPTEISFAQPGGGTVVTDSLSSPPAKDSGQKPKRRGGPGGLNKLCGVSPQLQAIVGQPAMPRTEIVKQLWAYIRKNNLQDPSNKRKIICNEELRLVFEVDCTDMFQMNKLLAKHILPLDPSKDSGQQSKKLKVVESEVPSSEPAPLIVISEALAKFFGTNKKEMLQSDVFNRIEEYIKTEGLEDPLNSMVVCDPKLQELLGCESITASAIRESLTRNHLSQQA